MWPFCNLLTLMAQCLKTHTFLKALYLLQTVSIYSAVAGPVSYFMITDECWYLWPVKRERITVSCHCVQCYCKSGLLTQEPFTTTLPSLLPHPHGTGLQGDRPAEKNQRDEGWVGVPELAGQNTQFSVHLPPLKSTEWWYDPPSRECSFNQKDMMMPFPDHPGCGVWQGGLDGGLALGASLRGSFWKAAPRCLNFFFRKKTYLL